VRDRQRAASVEQEYLQVEGMLWTRALRLYEPVPCAVRGCASGVLPAPLFYRDTSFVWESVC
jgi:hypothetical protein